MADSGRRKGKIDSKMEAVISALLISRTIEEAAKMASVGEHTIYRWLKLPEFVEAYREARREVVQHAVSQLQQAVGQAVAVLCEIMDNVVAPASSRVSAAKTIIEQALKAVEMEDIVSRIEKLEKFAEEKGA
jgi:hypothetical protein